jgi:hypothetical protein
VKYWEIIADNLSKAGWSWGCVSAFDSQGRTIWIVEAHRDDGKRYVVHADEKLTAFLELESAIGAVACLVVAASRGGQELGRGRTRCWARARPWCWRKSRGRRRRRCWSRRAGWRRGRSRCWEWSRCAVNIEAVAAVIDAVIEHKISIGACTRAVVGRIQTSP